MAGARKQWLANVSLYTLTGVASSLAVGALLGLTGDWLLPTWATDAGQVVVVVVAVVAGARELNWVRFRVPQPRRQTSEAWAKRYGIRKAAALWGLDLGTTVSARFTFAGTWALLIFALIAADPALGALALMSSWLGRAAPVWVAPLLVGERASAIDLMDAIAAQQRALRDSHVVGLALLVAFVVWTAL